MTLYTHPDTWILITMNERDQQQPYIIAGTQQLSSTKSSVYLLFVSYTIPTRDIKQHIAVILLRNCLSIGQKPRNITHQF
jgi:hypothetical protein